MRFLVDIAHPAHVHFFKHIMWGLGEGGHEVRVLARDKDVTHNLLEHYGFAFETIGRAGTKNRFGQMAELARRDWTLWRLSRQFRPHVVLTRNPSGTHAARLAGALAVFDSDDGRAAKLHYHLGAPFAHYITTPDCSREDLGRKQIRYPGYKQLAYLHPDHFVPDPQTRSDLGVAPDESFSMVRFVAMTASHDGGESGLADGAKQAIIDRLRRAGRVFITSETSLPQRWRDMKFPLPPHRLHDALAFAKLYVGDSQSMAAEAAVLGTTALQASTFAHRLDYLRELETRYGLMFAFHPTEGARLLEGIDALLSSRDLAARVREGRAKMLSDKQNVAKWFIRFLEQTVMANRGNVRRPIGHAHRM